jgi:hypothetical protein
MEMNEFLRDLNAEKKGTDEKLTWEEKGGKGVSGLDNLVAIMFDADRMSFFILYTRGTDEKERYPQLNRPISQPTPQATRPC